MSPGATTLKAKEGHLYIAFYGTCVSLFRAGSLAQARRKMEAKLGKAAAVNVRRATHADVARWSDAGGKGVR